MVDDHRVGMCLDRFFLVRVEQPPWLCIRVVRPAAPNAAQPAVDFACDLAEAKAKKIVDTIAPGGEIVGDFSPLLDADCEADRQLLGHHGCQLSLWWTRRHRYHDALAFAPVPSEEAFWSWLDEFEDTKRYIRPATQVAARLVTEAEFDWRGRELLLMDDVDWLTAEEFDDLHRRGGLARLLAGELEARPMSPESWRLAKLQLLNRALAADNAHNDRRAAAFRCIELSGYDSAAALDTIDRIIVSTTNSDDLKGIAYALGTALERMVDNPRAKSMYEQLGASTEPLPRQIVVEFDRLRRDRIEES